MKVIKIGITGSSGLLGYHLRAFLYSRKEFEVIAANKEIFADEAKMHDFVMQCDVIVHFAGMNRGDDALLYDTNIKLAQSLINAFEQSKVTPFVVFASSTHIARDSAYGRSKKQAGELFQTWADSDGGTFANLILPNVFGEFGRPFYNSVVSTFCYQIAHQEEPVIVNDAEIELIHVQEVAKLVLSVIIGKKHGQIRVSGYQFKVSQLLAQIQGIAKQYQAQLIPDLRGELDLQLFNTYRSYLFPDCYPVSLLLKSDDRGSLFEAVRSLNGGQTFLSSTHPGITRGNHYHLQKVERFLVVGGKATIRLRKLFESKVYEFQVSGDNPQYIDMPTFYTHNITNKANEPLLTVFWAHEIFDPQSPDTYQELV